MFEERFRALCEEAAERLGCYSHEHSTEGKLSVHSYIRPIVKLELVFKSASFGQVKNVLFCRIYPNKSNELYYLLPEAFVELGIPEYRSTFFSMIENEARLEACFNELMSILKERLPRIEEAAGEGLLPWAREVKEDDWIERKLLFPEVGEASSREPFVIYDHTLGSAYRALLNGKNEKAARILEKGRAKKKTLEYQNRLLEELYKNAEFSPMPEECNAVKTRDGLQKVSGRSFAIALLICAAGFTLLFTAVKAVFDAAFGAGTAAVFRAPWVVCLVCGLLPALFCTAALRKRFFRLLCGSSARSINEFDEIENGPRTNSLAKAGFGCTLGFAVGALIIIMICSVRVYSDRLDAPRDGAMFERETYLFSDVEKVYHIDARWNDFGERVERGSYVLYMKDGRKFDLDGSAGEKQTEEKLLPLLRGVETVRVDSDRDLP